MWTQFQNTRHRLCAHFTLQAKEKTFAHQVTELCDNSVLIMSFATNVIKQFTTPCPVRFFSITLDIRLYKSNIRFFYITLL